MVQGLRELIGRAMVDQDFLAELQRAPDVVLKEYTLNSAERATVLTALARLGQNPPAQRAHALRTALLRRLST
jgi:hypothetical protein